MAEENGEAARARWDARYRDDRRAASAPPAEVLRGLGGLLPRSGRALDIACGAGRNALFLAAQGLVVTGLDVSPVGLALAAAEARARGLTLALAATDLARAALPEGRFDVVCAIDYLERSLYGPIARALVPGGLLVFSTSTTAQLAFPEAHPRRAAFLLTPGELLAAFAGLEVVRYDEGVRRAADGSRSVRATLVARRPLPVGGAC